MSKWNTRVERAEQMVRDAYGDSALPEAGETGPVRLSERKTDVCRILVEHILSREWLINPTFKDYGEPVEPNIGETFMAYAAEHGLEYHYGDACHCLLILAGLGLAESRGVEWDSPRHGTRGGTVWRLSDQAAERFAARLHDDGRLLVTQEDEAGLYGDYLHSGNADAACKWWLL